MKKKKKKISWEQEREMALQEWDKIMLQIEQGIINQDEIVFAMTRLNVLDWKICDPFSLNKDEKGLN